VTDQDEMLERMQRDADKRERIAAGLVRGVAVLAGSLSLIALLAYAAVFLESCSTCLERGGVPVKGMVGPACVEPMR
jgi:hypothetical protein